MSPILVFENRSSWRAPFVFSDKHFRRAKGWVTCSDLPNPERFRDKANTMFHSPNFQKLVRFTGFFLSEKQKYPICLLSFWDVGGGCCLNCSYWFVHSFWLTLLELLILSLRVRVRDKTNTRVYAYNTRVLVKITWVKELWVYPQSPSSHGTGSVNVISI